MKFIAVLLTVHNRKKKTIHCLANLYAQQLVAGYEWDVYLVNDGCTDGTPETVKEQFPEVNIIEGDGTLYWNRGMYKAWQVAVNAKEYNYYLWLNDDTALFDDALNVLVNTSKKKKDESIIVGSTYSKKKSIITYGGRAKSGKLISPEKNLKQCHHFNGNIVLIPQHVYHKIGMNDPIFHHYLGDFDYGMRATKLNINSYLAPSILGICDLHESLPTWCNPKYSFKYRWKTLRSPLGHNPEEFFTFNRRHYGLMKAIFNYITNHLRATFPSLWTQ